MNEVWKDIKGYEGVYEVSNFGRVRSLDREIVHTRKGTTFIYHHRGQILTPNPTLNGYLSVRLRWLNKGEFSKDERRFIHRLVAEAFVPNPNNLETVNHKDEDKTNNCANNLEWMSMQDNLMYGTRVERISNANINNQKRAKKVAQYSLDGELIRVFPSYAETKRNGYFNVHTLAHGEKHGYDRFHQCVWKPVYD